MSLSDVPNGARNDARAGINAPNNESGYVSNDDAARKAKIASDQGKAMMEAARQAVKQREPVSQTVTGNFVRQDAEPQPMVKRNILTRIKEKVVSPVDTFGRKGAAFNQKVAQAADNVVGQRVRKVQARANLELDKPRNYGLGPTTARKGLKNVHGVLYKIGQSAVAKPQTLSKREGMQQYVDRMGRVHVLRVMQKKELRGGPLSQQQAEIVEVQERGPDGVWRDWINPDTRVNEGHTEVVVNTKTPSQAIQTAGRYFDTVGGRPIRRPLPQLPQSTGTSPENAFVPRRPMVSFVSFKGLPRPRNPQMNYSTNNTQGYGNAIQPVASQIRTPMPSTGLSDRVRQNVFYGMPYGVNQSFSLNVRPPQNNQALRTRISSPRPPMMSPLMRKSFGQGMIRMPTSNTGFGGQMGVYSPRGGMQSRTTPVSQNVKEIKITTIKAPKVKKVKLK